MKTKKYFLVLFSALLGVSTAFANYTIEFRVHNNSAYTWYPTIIDTTNLLDILKEELVAPKGKHTEPKLMMGDRSKSKVTVVYRAIEKGKVIAACNYHLEIKGDNVKQTKEEGFNDEDCGFARSPFLDDNGNPFGGSTTVEIHPILDYKK